MRQFIFKYVFNPYKRICIVLAYAWQGMFSYDWDYDYLLNDIEFKIKRMKKYLTKEGLVDKKTLDSLQLSLRCLERWRANEGDELYNKILTQKYGELRFIKVKDVYKSAIPFKMKREKETSINEKQIQQESLQLAEEGRKIDEVNRDSFFNSLKNNIESWWS